VRSRRNQCDVPTSSLPEDELPLPEILRAAHEVALRNAEGPLVLAVSGGRDSMALLHATARWAPERIAAVATFDHGTGSYATEAAALVASEGRRLGLTVVRERARVAATSEAGWRDARWNFLHRVARAHRARVATAHTRDDQIETVFMRVLRGSGARGLAALAAPSPIVRPWLGVARAEIASWAFVAGVPFLEDPTNSSPRYQRSRVRHDLLPAFERASPGFGADLLRIADRAAAWRRDVESYIDAVGPVSRVPGTLQVPASPLVETSPEGCAVLWQALFARIGVILDSRGTRELVRFTSAHRPGAMVTLAKGALVIRVGHRDGDVFELRRGSQLERRSVEWTGPAPLLPARVGGWRFRRVGVARGGPAADVPAPESDLWESALPAGTQVTVRLWKAGDRIRTAGAHTGRRVTRYFAEAKTPALDRAGWPVVLVENELVWVPGICRSIAVPHRPGRPDLIWYRCEREHDRSW
jgi:tRNA(Ile)-lysidine synthase